MYGCTTCSSFGLTPGFLYGCVIGHIDGNGAAAVDGGSGMLSVVVVVVVPPAPVEVTVVVVVGMVLSGWVKLRS
eukprot:COSAG05_NODE_7394_length_818_cov_1.289291_1_plen_74_part_00